MWNTEDGLFREGEVGQLGAHHVTVEFCDILALITSDL